MESLYHQIAHLAWRLSALLGGYFHNTYTGRIAADFSDLFLQLWYFVAVGALLSTAVEVYLPVPKVRRLLQRHTSASIVGASALGLLSPLCTFAAIPVVGQLIRQGVPAAPLLAFTVASPLINPALFVYTAGTISLEMAVARLVSAFATGLAAGLAAHWALRHWTLELGNALTPQPAAYAPVAGGSDLGGRDRWRFLAYRFYRNLRFIGKYFALGLLIAALVKNLLDRDLILALLGPGSNWAIPTAMALGVPLYACGGGSIPIIDSMMRLGMAPGAALAFFIAGPATKFQTLTVFGAIFGRRWLGFYLGVMLASALVWGYAYPFGNAQLEIEGSGGAVYEELIGD